MIFKSILAPVDGSVPSNAAVSLAVQLAKESGASLVFCHALHVPRPAHDAGGFAREQMMEDEMELAHEVLDAAKKQASASGVVATTVVLADPIGDAILDAAREHGSDVIVMGSHGRGGIARAVLGSKTAEIIDRASIPVMVAPRVFG